MRNDKRDIYYELIGILGLLKDKEYECEISDKYQGMWDVELLLDDLLMEIIDDEELFEELEKLSMIMDEEIEIDRIVDTLHIGLWNMKDRIVG